MQRIEAQPHTLARPSLWAGRVALGRFVLTLSINRAHGRAEFREQIINRLAALRRERGLTCEELAARLQIHPSTLSAMERGGYMPSLSLALRLSEVFELPIEAIFVSPSTKYLA